MRSSLFYQVCLKGQSGLGHYVYINELTMQPSLVMPYSGFADDIALFRVIASSSDLQSDIELFHASDVTGYIPSSYSLR